MGESQTRIKFTYAINSSFRGATCSSSWIKEVPSFLNAFWGFFPLTDDKAKKPHVYINRGLSLVTLPISNDNF